jgi:hypothetical protein
MNGPEQESSLKTFLTKLLNFTRRINVYKKEKISISIQFEEIPAALIVAFCILPYAMAKMEVSIYTRYTDTTLWDFLNNKTFYSNSKNHRIFIHDFLIEEITPFLFQNQNPIMLVINTFFFKIARTFNNRSIMYILPHGVNFCLSEALCINVEELLPKQRYSFTLHDVCTNPIF